MRTLLISLAIACLSACSFVGFPGVYKIDVEQGNIITQEMADQLQPGMSRRQVRFILGTPLVEDTFNQDGDALQTVTGDYLPAAWQDPDSTDAAEPPAPDPAADAS